MFLIMSFGGKRLSLNLLKKYAKHRIAARPLSSTPAKCDGGSPRQKLQWVEVASGESSRTSKL